MDKIRYVIVGSGWRSEFYARIAKALPDKFEAAAMLCRTEAKAKQMEEKLGVYTTTSEAECRSLKPDFIVVAVDKPSVFKVSRNWLDKGWPVLCETPAGLKMEDLEDAWRFHCYGTRFQVAEQYHLYPRYEKILEVVKSGVLGDPQAVDLSAAHDYHAVSLIRRILGVGFENAFFTGKRFTFPVLETAGRDGIIENGQIKDSYRIRMDMEFDSGKMGFYDFDKIQYHSRIRGIEIRIQGDRGELSGNHLTYVDSDGIFYEETISWENPYADLGFSEDETAIVKMLEGMKQYVDNGTECYPVAEALQDAYFSLCMEKALLHPYETIQSQTQMWGY